MAANKRIYYAIEGVGFAQLGNTTYTAMHGVQSAAASCSFGLEPISELGQASIYENVEVVPAVEFNLEKVLDGYAPLWCQATAGAANGTLQGRFNQRTTIALNVYGDTQSSASGVPISATVCSGMYPVNPAFNLTTDAISKETLGFQGNDKLTISSSFPFNPQFLNTDVPFAQTSGSGGVQRRRDMIFYPQGMAGSLGTLENGSALDANGQVIAFLTILPPDIPGISPSGTNDRDGTGAFGAHVQSISCSCQLARQDIFEFGRQGPYFKYPVTPVQNTCEISVIGTLSDNVSAAAEGILTGINTGFNLVNRTIKIRMREGLWIDMGTKNKLTSIGYQGGGTDGSNLVYTYSYQNNNDFTVTHPQDPTPGIAWPY